MTDAAPSEDRLRLKLLADGGDMESQKLYGSMLRDGKGGPKDPEDARHYFQVILLFF